MRKETRLMLRRAGIVFFRAFGMGLMLVGALLIMGVVQQVAGINSCDIPVVNRVVGGFGEMAIGFLLIGCSLVAEDDEKG